MNSNTEELRQKLLTVTPVLLSNEFIGKVELNIAPLLEQIKFLQPNTKEYNDLLVQCMNITYQNITKEVADRGFIKY